jgi:hypothetical protein
MSAHTREDVAVEFEEDGVGEARKTEDGGMVIAFERWAPGLDTTEMFRDLPDGACWEQHWGYCVQGSVVLHYADGRPDEKISAGQAYYMAPGHTPVVGDGDELVLVEFTPAHQRPDQKPE